MAQVWTWGPCDVWCGVGAGGAPLFLGHSEEGPDVSWKLHYHDHRVDLGGDVPMDVAYLGREGRVMLSLARFQMSTYDIIHSVSNPVSPGTPGVEDPGEIGSLMLLEGKAYKLWLRSTYSAKSVFANTPSGSAPPGLRWAAAYLVDDSWGRLGAKPRKINLTFRCLRVFDPTISNAAGYGRFTIYDTDMSALGAIS